MAARITCLWQSVLLVWLSWTCMPRICTCCCCCCFCEPLCTRPSHPVVAPGILTQQCEFPRVPCHRARGHLALPVTGHGDGASWLIGLSWFYPVIPGKYRDRSLKWASAVFFRILCSSLLNSSNIRRWVLTCAVGASLNNPVAVLVNVVLT
jgi:hypothetical protein